VVVIEETPIEEAKKEWNAHVFAYYLKDVNGENKRKTECHP
jgi:hypothetical protein